MAKAGLDTHGLTEAEQLFKMTVDSKEEEDGERPLPGALPVVVNVKAIFGDTKAPSLRSSAVGAKFAVLCFVGTFLARKRQTTLYRGNQHGCETYCHLHSEALRLVRSLLSYVS
jgi:hypothetical protein